MPGRTHDQEGHNQKLALPLLLAAVTQRCLAHTRAGEFACSTCVKAPVQNRSRYPTCTPPSFTILTLRPMRAFLSTMQFLMTVPAPTPRGTPPSASTFWR